MRFQASEHEATASAAVIIGEGVPAEDVFVETTSFDTIGNAFYSRNDHCSLAGWRRLLVITSEFHLARTKAIFDWVYGAAGAEPSRAGRRARGRRLVVRRRLVVLGGRSLGEPRTAAAE